MYDPKRIQASFVKLVGFLPANDPNTPPISGDLLLSDTGLYVSNIHPLCTLDYLYLAAPDFTASKYMAWVSDASYVAGNIATGAGIIYKCLSDVTSATPPADDAVNWVVYNPFQNWLQNLFNAASSNLIGAVVQKKKLLHMGNALLERQQLYRGLGQSSNNIVGNGSMVGVMIKPVSAEGLLVIIDKIGIQATQAQGEMIYYLYHSSDESQPLQIFHVPIAEAYTFAWADLIDIDGNPCILGYMGHNTDSSGFYIFSYYQTDLVGQAISKQWDCSITPCAGCDGINAAWYNKWSRHTKLRNIQVAAPYVNEDRSLPDINRISYDTNSNWGLNLSITVRCDLTDTIIYSRLLFGDAFAKQLAYECLKVIAYSSRISGGEGTIKSLAMADLDTNIPGAFINDYLKAVDTVNMDLSGFSAACMPKDATNDIEWSGSI